MSIKPCITCTKDHPKGQPPCEKFWQWFNEPSVDPTAPVLTEDEVTDLKIAPRFFNDILNGTKRCEVRKADRRFYKGQQIRLREWDGNAYTGRSVKIVVTHILRDRDFPAGIKEGYCILSFFGGVEVPE